MLSDLGFTVLRQIPTEFLPGLLSGAYSLHGGVLRDGGGRIVAHLLTSGPADLLKSLVPGVDALSGVLGNAQLFALSRSVEALQASVATTLQLSAAATATAGLGLVATVAGVAYLDRRLGRIERHLESIDEKLEDLRRAVVTYHFASLKGAMDNLRHAEQDKSEDRKRGMLLDAKRDFQAARHYYHDRLKDARGAQEFAALEECLTLAMAGSALSASELGMFDIAAADFEAQLPAWRELARRFVQDWIHANGHDKLLDAPADELPAGELVALLDFAEGSTCGWARIDQLRRARQEQAGDKEPFRPPWNKKPEQTLSLEPLRTATVLRQREGVLDAQREHLNFLAARGMSAREFAEHARQDLSSLGTEAIFVVAPPLR